MSKNKPIKYQEGEIIERKILTDRVHKIKLKPEEPFNWIPGQFIITKTDIDGNEKIADYTIISSTDEIESLDILVDNYPGSKVGKIIHNKKLGETITFKAPRGRFTLEETNKDIVFVWRDIGLAAGLPLLQQMMDKNMNNSITILNFLTDDFDDLFPKLRENFENLNINYLSFTSNDIKTELLDTGNFPKKQMEQLFSKYIESIFYISGSSEFVKKIRQKFIQIGVDKDNIVREVFG